MLGHKRRASDTLLPLRASKQPRTTTHHPLGGNSTPSQDYALLARWTRLTVDFMHILKDTASFFVRRECMTHPNIVPMYEPEPSTSRWGHQGRAHIRPVPICICICTTCTRARFNTFASTLSSTSSFDSSYPQAPFAPTHTHFPGTANHFPPTHPALHVSSRC